MNKLLTSLLFIFTLFISLVSAGTFNGDMTGRGIYGIDNITHLSSNGDVNSTDVYATWLHGDGSNITGVSLIMTNSSVNNTQLEVRNSKIQIITSWLTSFINTVFGTKTTDDLTEGSSNLYYNDSAVVNTLQTDVIILKSANVSTNLRIDGIVNDTNTVIPKWSIDDVYLHNVSSVLTFNETKMLVTVSGVGYITDGNSGWNNIYGFVTDANLTETDPIANARIDNLNNGTVSGYFNNIANFTTYLTDTKICTYNGTAGKIECTTSPSAGSGGFNGTQDMNPDTNNTYDIGASGLQWQDLYAIHLYQNKNAVLDISTGYTQSQIDTNIGSANDSMKTYVDATFLLDTGDAATGDYSFTGGDVAFTPNNNISINGRFIVAGDSVIDGDLFLSGNLTVNDLVTGSVNKTLLLRDVSEVVRGNLTALATGGVVSLYDGSGNKDVYLSTVTGENSYINSGGNVGIGTTNPSYKLQVETSSSGNVITQLMLKNPNSVAGTGNAIGFISYDGATNTGKITNTNLGGGVYDMQFATFHDSALTTDMTIKDGNVGIGTESPGAKLNIAGTTSDTLLRLSSTETSQVWDAWLAGTDRNLYIEAQGNEADLFFRDYGNTITLQLDHSANDVLIPSGELVVSGTGDSSIAGNVGIGTTNPGAKLDIYSTTGGVTGLKVNAEGAAPISWHTSSGTLFGSLSYSGSDAVVRAGSGKKLMLAGNAGSSDMVIDTNGNVGIGTVTPHQKLEVSGNANITGTLYADSISAIGDTIDLTASGNFTTSNNLVVHGDGIFDNNIYVAGNLTVNDLVTGNVNYSIDVYDVSETLRGSLVAETSGGELLLYDSSSNLDVNISSSGVSKFANAVEISSTLDSNTLNTGQGDYELYAMNQDVLTTSDVTFSSITDGTATLTAGDLTGVLDANVTDLDVAGTLGTDGDATIGGDLTVTDANDGKAIKIKSGAAYGGIVLQNSAGSSDLSQIYHDVAGDDLIFYNNIIGLTIDHLGNVVVNNELTSDDVSTKQINIDQTASDHGLKVDMSLASYDGGVQIYRDDGAEYDPYYELRDDKTYYRLGMARGSGENFYLQANGTIAFVVDSDGNVGIGTSSPDSKLTIDTNGNAQSINIDSEASSANFIYANMNASSATMNLGNLKSGTATYDFTRNVHSGISEGYVMRVVQDNAGDDYPALYVRQDAVGIPAVTISGTCGTGAALVNVTYYPGIGALACNTTHFCMAGGSTLCVVKG